MSDVLSIKTFEREFSSNAQKIKKPRALKLTEIILRPDIFQQRMDQDEDRLRKDQHIENLVRSIKFKSNLDPILVLPYMGQFVCIDGHHRIAAYKAAKIKDNIPVEVFEGTFKEALEVSLTQNIKDKLSMTRSEKTEAAWRFLNTGMYTWKELISISGCGRGTIQRMSKRIKDMSMMGIEAESLTWENARKWRTEEQANFTDEQEKALIHKEVQTISRMWGPRAHKRTHIIAKALLIYSEQTARLLHEALEEEIGEKYEPDDYEEDDF